MKKILLPLLAACACFSAAAADFSQLWSKSAENAFTADNKQWNAPVTTDKAGNVIATGAFTEDFTLAGSSLEAIGTSAYIVKYDNAGNAAWAVAFTGAASIIAIDTDADGNIYVAGSFADEVSFGSTSGDAIVKEGMKVDGDFTAKKNAAYVAKYDKDGKALDVLTIIPEIQPDLVEKIGLEVEPPYWYADGDVSFDINDMQFSGEKLYLSATYSGVSKIGETVFDAGYVLYFGFMYQDNTKGTLFTLDPSLDNCSKIINVGDDSENGAMVFDTNSVWSVMFNVENDKLVSAIVGAGQLRFNNDIIYPQYDDKGNLIPHFIYTTFVNGTKFNQFADLGNSATSTADNCFKYVTRHNDKIYILGQRLEVESTTVDDVTTTVEKKAIFVTEFVELADMATKSTAIVDGDISYYDITSAAVLPNGDLFINVLANYNTAKEGEYKNGEFANASKSFVFANNAFTPDDTVSNAVGVATAGSYIAFSQIAETGTTFSLYEDKNAAGIEDIVADENAPVEYYNLQGIRVDNPAAGSVVIRRQGANTTKVLVK